MAGFGCRPRHAQPRDVFLVIEVAESSRDYDHAKLRFYARAGMQEVWIVDLQNEGIDVHREPLKDDYGVVRTVRRGESLTCLAFPEVSGEVDEVLGDNYRS
jgi:Uma2 family endonuclease